MNMRRKRRRDLERWRKRRPKPLFDPSILEAVAGIIEAAEIAARSIFSAAQTAATAFISFGHLLAHAITHDEPNAPFGPQQEMTLAELRKDAGGDGASMGSVRFNAEGGFSVN